MGFQYGIPGRCALRISVWRAGADTITTRGTACDDSFPGYLSSYAVFLYVWIRGVDLWLQVFWQNIRHHSMLWLDHIVTSSAIGRIYRGHLEWPLGVGKFAITGFSNRVAAHAMAHMEKSTSRRT